MPLKISVAAATKKKGGLGGSPPHQKEIQKRLWTGKKQKRDAEREVGGGGDGAMVALFEILNLATDLLQLLFSVLQDFLCDIWAILKRVFPPTIIEINTQVVELALSVLKKLRGRRERQRALAGHRMEDRLLDTF